jgi:hypothetical protein
MFISLKIDVMKLYHRKYFNEDKKEASPDQRKETPYKADVEHLINQAIIWVVIVFLAVVTIKKFF